MVGYSITYFLECQASTGASYGNMVEQGLDSPNIIIKVPLEEPHQSYLDGPETIDDHLSGKGQFYQIKAQQVVNDTLYVYCAYDQNAREHFVDLIAKINISASADPAGAPKDSHSLILKNFLKEYVDNDHKVHFLILEWISGYPGAAITNVPIISGIKPDVTLPPPNLA